MPSPSAFFWALLYVSSSAGEVLALRSLALLPLRLPALTGLLSNQMYLLLLPSYLSALRVSASLPHTLSFIQRLLQYAVCGALTGAITICRNVAVTLLPGSVFALLISSSILFSVALSVLVSRAQLNAWHCAAVACCLGSALAIALSALLPAQGARAAGGSVDFPVGIPVALTAACFIACMGIAQELYQASWGSGPLFDLYLLENTMASSIVATLCVCAYGAATGEFPAWAPQLAQAAAQSSAARGLVIGVCLALPVLKLAIRNSKYAVILASSALFFEFVQASAALVASVSSVLAFSEPFGAGFIAAIALLAVAFGLYAKAKVEAKQAKAAAAAEAAAAAKGGAAEQAAVVHSPLALAVEAWGERAQWHSQPLRKGGKAAWRDAAPEGGEDRRVVI